MGDGRMIVYFSALVDMPGRWVWEFRWDVLDAAYNVVGEFYLVQYNPLYARAGEWWDGYVLLAVGGEEFVSRYAGKSADAAIEGLLEKMGWELMTMEDYGQRIANVG